MSIHNDETLQVYIDESIEHLADIESDLLSIEEGGADIDEDLVNKVYRAAHSIKGGAGFMGLSNIKDLTHEMENILGKIRSREMAPNAEIINILLLASDALRSLINDVDNSNEIDVSEHIRALNSLTEGQLSEDVNPSENKRVDALFLDGGFAFEISGDVISGASKEGKYIYLVEIDLIRDVLMKDRMPRDLLNEMQDCGVILDGMMDLSAAGTLKNEGIMERLPFLVLFATILKPDDINVLFEINRKCIFELSEDLAMRCLGEEMPVGIDSPEAGGPEPEREQVDGEESVSCDEHEEPEAIATESPEQDISVKENRRQVNPVPLKPVFG